MTAVSITLIAYPSQRILPWPPRAKGRKLLNIEDLPAMALRETIHIWPSQSGEEKACSQGHLSFFVSERNMSKDVNYRYQVP